MTKGIKTTEFWLGLATVLLTYFNKELNLDLPVEGIIAISAMVLSYIASRTYLKTHKEVEK